MHLNLPCCTANRSVIGVVARTIGIGCYQGEGHITVRCSRVQHRGEPIERVFNASPSDWRAH